MDNYLISEDQIKEIRSNVDIVEVISDYLPLTPKGKNFFGVCPFHSDHSPSMSVSREKQIYTCFSCGASGNVFKFVMDYENISFYEAIKKLASKAGITLNIKAPKQQNSKYEVLYEIYDISKKIYQNNLNSKEGLNAKEYLKNRNITSEIIKEFEIGLSLKNNKILTNMFLKKEYNKKDLLLSGLINENEGGLYDIYYNRIMFPLYDLSGKIVGYSGRIYDHNDSSKYVNTKETPIFKKGEILYNYHRAKEEARKAGKIIVVEGFMDVIAAYKVGVKNVVATMGTAVTSNQANLIKRMAKEVILCFDGDAAGAKATQSCSDELLKIGVTPKVVRLEDNLDPDEFITKYGLEFVDRINNPISVIDFKLKYLKKDIDITDNVEYSKYINSSLEEIGKIDDTILRELTIKKLSEESKIDAQILKEKLNDFEVKIEIPVLEENVNNKKVTKFQKAEQYLVYYMLNNKEVVTIFNNQKVFLPTEKYRKLAREISLIAKNSEVNIADIMTSLETNEALETIKELLRLNLKDEYTKDEILDYINTITINNLETEKKHLKDLLKMTIEKDKKNEIALKIIEITKKEQEIKKEGYNGK